MTPGDRTPVGAILLWFVFFVGLLVAVLAGDGPDPCEIDAPMEAAHCRATAGPRPEWLVRK